MHYGAVDHDGQHDRSSNNKRARYDRDPVSYHGSLVTCMTSLLCLSITARSLPRRKHVTHAVGDGQQGSHPVSVTIYADMDAIPVELDSSGVTMAEGVGVRR